MLDRIGNTLKKGQMVQIVIPAPHLLLAQVEQVSGGGIIGGHDGMIVPEQIILTAVITMQMQPNQSLDSVVVVQSPPTMPPAEPSAASKVSH
jgi:hypothetical protein